MIINLKLTKVDEAKLLENMRKKKMAFSQNEVKRYFYDLLNRDYVS